MNVNEHPPRDVDRTVLNSTSFCRLQMGCKCLRHDWREHCCQEFSGSQDITRPGWFQGGLYAGQLAAAQPVLFKELCEKVMTSACAEVY